MLMWGLAAGLLVGLVAALVLARPARTLPIAGFGVAGCMVVAALSFLIPNQYISSAVLRAGPGALPIEQLFDADLMTRVVAAEANQGGARAVQSVEELRRRLTIRNVEVSTPGAERKLTAFVVSFQSADRFGAQRVVREAVSQALQKQSLAGNGGKPWTPGTLVPPPAQTLQVLDPASYPGGPAWPNRLTIALIGLLAGMIVGAWFMRTKRTAAPA
jgi:LPS O-antigen subunit length determinant protein (WzzB/FepE family)